jgi:hypothetical protein
MYYSGEKLWQLAFMRCKCNRQKTSKRVTQRVRSSGKMGKYKIMNDDAIILLLLFTVADAFSILLCPATASSKS